MSVTGTPGSTSACGSLVDDYVKTSGKTQPADSAATEDKRNWLLEFKWECWDGTQLQTKGGALAPPGTDPNAHDPCENATTRHPLTKLTETGFLAFVNERGLRCVHAIQGRIKGVDPTTGALQQPGLDHPVPAAHCMEECANVYGGSPQLDACADCVVKYRDRPLHGYQRDGSTPWVANDATACPAFAGVSDAEVKRQTKEALRCTDCQGEFLLRHKPTGDQDPDFVHAWQCLKQDTPPPQHHARFIGAMVGVGVMFVLYVSLVTYMLVKWAKEGGSKTSRTRDTPTTESNKAGPDEDGASAAGGDDSDYGL